MKLTAIDNIAFCEYEAVEDPEFQLDNKGYLMIFGYKMSFAGKEIGCAKGFDLKSNNYTVIGKYNAAKEVIINIDALVNDFNIDKNNCVFLRFTTPTNKLNQK